MKMFAGKATLALLSRLGMKEGDQIEAPMLTRAVEKAQRKVEERNFQIRKNILEYDEVMEHQRQAFYGLRQRVLEGRDVRGLIFTYIKDATKDAASEYLAPGYAAKCASEYVREKLDVTIFPDRLKGLELNEMDKRIREEAKAEARQMIQVTLGEYIADESSEVEMDFDAEGLARWARSHFGVEFNPEEIRQKGQAGRRAVQEALCDAAFARIDEADLSELTKFVDAGYGRRELCKWADKKFGIKITPEEVEKAQTQASTKGEVSPIEKLILDQAEKLYTKREIEYPIEFAMSATMGQMRQNPAQALQQLVSWANERYQLGWSPETVMKTPPQQIRQQLLDASKRFVESGELQKRVAAAVAIADPESLEKHLKETLRIDPPEKLRRLKGVEREQAIRAAMESSLRSELLYFERTMLIETLDDLWKDHLYQMDQLRDTINYRAFSQQDPRIEYKREGSKLFKQMLETVRDRITDYVFTVTITPQAPAAPVPPPGPPARSGPAGGNGSGGLYVPPSNPAKMPGGGMISGPGIG